MRRVNDHEETVARFVDVAAALLAEHGPQALALRRVAAAAGTSTMAVYTLFGDKARLLAAMHREGFRRLGEALRAVPSTADPVADLLALGLAYRDAALASRHLYELMFGRPIPQFRPDSEGQAVADAAYQPLLAAVRRCQDAGVLTGEQPEPIALHLWAVAHGMVSLEINAQLPESAGPADEAYRQALTFAGQAFLPAPDATS